MNPTCRQTLLLVGTDSHLIYLLRRFAEQGGYPFAVVSSAMAARENMASNLAAILFLSLGDLELAQSSAAELAGLETPLIVCASVADAARARELGADTCLFHPMTYEHFAATMAAARRSKAADSGFRTNISRF